MTEGKRWIEYVPLSAVKRWPKNPRKHATEELKLSLDRFGLITPLVQNESNGELLAGHGRMEALSRLKADGGSPPPGVVLQDGEWMVPVVRGLTLSEEEHGGAVISDNRMNELGWYPEKDLAEILRRYDEAGHLEGIGFAGSEVSKLLATIDSGDSLTAGLGNPVVQYTLVFDDEDQQKRFHGLIRDLKERYPAEGSIAARLDRFIRESSRG